MQCSDYKNRLHKSFIAKAIKEEISYTGQNQQLQKKWAKDDNGKNKGLDYNLSFLSCSESKKSCSVK